MVTALVDLVAVLIVDVSSFLVVLYALLVLLTDFVYLGLLVGAHFIYALQTEACSKQGDLYLAAKSGVGGQTPFCFHVVTELAHEVVDFVHLFHHEGTVLVVGTEIDVEQDLLGVEYVVVVKQR